MQPVILTADEKNLPQNCLTVSNHNLNDVFSDIFEKSSRSITEQILFHPGEIFDVAPYIHGRCKTPNEKLQVAIGGAIFPEQSMKFRQCLEHINELEEHIEKVTQELLRVDNEYQSALELIRTVP